MESNVSNSCLYSPEDKALYTAWFTVNLLLLPIFLYVFYVGYKRHRKHRCVSVHSHTDVITFHMVALEVCGIVFSCLHFSGYYSGPNTWSKVGGTVVVMSWVGQAAFHGLTCVERYLAVVHPITYLRLKKKGGVVVRNLSIGCVWLFILGHAGLKNVEEIQSTFTATASFMKASFALIITGFCSVSIICVLIRPGPGERGRDKRILDQSKRSAFDTVVIIMAVLLLRFLALLMTNSLYYTGSLNTHRCILRKIWTLFSIPSSLVLPLLYLHRTGTLKTRKDSPSHS